MTEQIKSFALLLASFLHASISVADMVKLAPMESRGLIEKVELRVKDEVSGGCWTNVHQITQNARLKLEQSNISVRDDVDLFSPAHAAIEITAMGGKVRKDGCAGNIRVSIVRFDNLTYASTSIGAIVSLEDASTMVSDRSLNVSFGSFVDSVIAEFSAGVLAARRDPRVIEAKKNIGLE